MEALPPRKRRSGASCGDEGAQLDDSLAEAHASAALLYTLDLQLERGIGELVRSNSTKSKLRYRSPLARIEPHVVRTF